MDNMYNNALFVLRTIKNKGFEAYFIGGSTRNLFHNQLYNENLPIKDYDIVTNASYSDIKNMFGKVEERGEAFNVAVVKIGQYEFEVAQYRTETYPEGGSTRPSEVKRAETLKEDVLRRDFTINGIALDENNQIIDFVGGQEDINNRIIKTIGNPKERFSEDPLRMIRAFRFMGQLGYDLDQDTLQGIKDNIKLLDKIPHERIKEEINKMLKGKYAGKAIKEIKQLGRMVKFLNTINDAKQLIFHHLFALPTIKFESTLKLLDSVDKTSLSLPQIYSILYRFVPYENALKDINNMYALNNSQIREFTIYVKNHNIIFYQSRYDLLTLSKDIDIYGKGNRESLNKVLEFYMYIYNITLTSLNQYFDRPLLKKELPFNGNDILNKGKEIGLNEPGQWVSETIELARTLSIMGEDYSLDRVVTLIYNKLQKEL